MAKTANGKGRLKSARSAKLSGELGTVRSEKVAVDVARRILEDIVQQNLEPGTKLSPEVDMLEEYNVGRASLREALRLLELYGLIRLKTGPNGGPTVNEVLSENFALTATFFFYARRARFQDLLEARLAIEPMMAKAAARTANKETRALLRENLELARIVANESGEEWERVTSDFHGLVAGLSGNPVLDLIGKSLSVIHHDRVRALFPVGKREPVLSVHERIGQAIIDRDGDKAEELSRRHIQAQIKLIGQLRPEMPDQMIDWR
jgi:GntR family transcriptional regulator, transcriptional repressor for pyruvate dehydrogenase complex